MLTLTFDAVEQLLLLLPVVMLPLIAAQCQVVEIIEVGRELFGKQRIGGNRVSILISMHVGGEGGIIQCEQLVVLVTACMLLLLVLLLLLLVVVLLVMVLR